MGESGWSMTLRQVVCDEGQPAASTPKRTAGRAPDGGNMAGGCVGLIPAQIGSRKFPGRGKFAYVSDAGKAALMRASSRLAVKPSDFIYIQEDDADHLFFILSGHVRLSHIMEDGSAILSSILPAGEAFGELGVFEGGSYCDTATAAGKVVLLAIHARAFRGICLEYGEIEQALARLVARRYRAYIEVTRNLSLKSLPARLAICLLRLIDSIGAHVDYFGREVPCIGPMVTQSDLGLMSRGSRGNVNRALRNWERSQWIAQQDRSILVLNREKLEAFAVSEGL
jgi:CRP-like cAMP-binding protein